MSVLLIATFSQALQAFLPVGVALAWLYRHGAHASARVVRLALIAAVLLSPAAGSLLQQTARQSQLEATLAALATGMALAALWAAVRAVRRGSHPDEPTPLLSQLALAGATLVVVLRQTMEIALVLRVAAFDLRSLDATVATAGGLLLGIAAACACGWAARAAPMPAADTATTAFGVLFAAQAAFYAFHESAESRWLPWSDVLHAATEPYGPDGIYGPLGSCLVAGLPLVLGIAIVAGTRRWRPSRAMRPWMARAIVGTLLIAGSFVFLEWANGRFTLPPVPLADALAAGRPAAGSAIARSGQLLFRRTNIGSDYGLLTVAGLEPAAATTVAALACDRVSFGGGRGICLQANRGIFTTYRAVLFDEMLNPVRSLAIDGSPSRTRISPDGRVGAVTVFDTGIHSYSASTFSTITTLVDMATGDSLGKLEEFSTWRNGAQFKAIDFNFWGVTFARDTNTFYATLRTGGKTYLVRGDLMLRKLTVLRENVECPSLSPNNRLIAFKKRVGAPSAPWRVYVLDLASMKEHVLDAESRSIDDQIEWLDDARVLYAIPRASPSAIADVWVAPVDGSAPARVLLPEAESPIVIR